MQAIRVVMGSEEMTMSVSNMQQLSYKNMHVVRSVYTNDMFELVKSDMQRLKY